MSRVTSLIDNPYIKQFVKIQAWNKNLQHVTIMTLFNFYLKRILKCSLFII